MSVSLVIKLYPTNANKTTQEQNSENIQIAILSLKQKLTARTAHTCVCISLCTIVVHNREQKSADNLPSYSNPSTVR